MGGALDDNPHACDLTALPAGLAGRFVELPRGSDAAAASLLARRHGGFKTRVHALLRWFLSDFDVNGLLGMYPMHLLDTSQWQALLGGGSARRLLDVGAG